jgi:hypothetical protein
MMMRKWKPYILPLLCLTLATMMLFVMVAGRPARLEAAYWVKLGVLIVGWLVFFLALPFCRRIRDIRLLPEQAVFPIVASLLLLFLVALVVTSFGALAKGNVTVIIVVALVAYVILRIVWEMTQSKRPRRKRNR